MGGDYIYPELNIQNFSSFINTKNNKPLDTLFRNTTRIYDNEGKYYLEFKSTNEQKDKNYSLKNSDGNELCELRGIYLDKVPIWLNDCLIIDKTTNKKYGKCVIDFKTGKQQFYEVKESFESIGQDNNVAYFTSNYGLNKIGKLKVKSRHSIIAISNEGIKLELDNKSYQTKRLIRNHQRWHWRWQYTAIDKDTVNLNLFYNNTLLIKGKEINKVELNNSEFIFKKKSFKIQSVYKNVSYKTNYRKFQNSIYIRLQNDDIYKLDSNGLSIAIAFKIQAIPGELIDFRLEGNYLIFKTYVDIEMNEQKTNSWINQNGFEIKNNPSGYDLIGIVDLKTNEVFYPKII
jgi:hypothetical protein